MIYTVTFNPSLDYVIQVDDLTLGEVNRTTSEKIYPGGKGNNVSVILSNLGHKSKALGFKAGFTGEQMETMLEEFGCYTDFIPLEEGLTRINVKVKSNEESEINGQGPVITDTAIEALYQKLDKLTAGDVLVLAGSIPNTLPGDMYERIMERLQGKEIRIAVDATKDLLVNVLKYHPFLIKPNNHELGEIFGKVLESEADIVEYAKKLQEMGAVNVLISMAGDGAILVTEDGTVSSKKPPKGTVVNSVGAGDSMVAGFLAGWLNTGDYEKALELGTAAGSATAFVSWLATREEITEKLERTEKEYGAVNVLISMAGDGAILVTEDGTVSSKKPPKGTVVNSVGAGDSMVAGFLAGWLNTGDYEKALELGTAAGSATAFVSWLATREEITEKLERTEKEYGI